MLPNVHNIARNMSRKTKQTIFLLLEYSLKCFKRYKTVQNYEQKKPARNLYEKCAMAYQMWSRSKNPKYLKHSKYFLKL